MYRWMVSIIAASLVVATAVFALSPTTAQDTSEERIDDLEQRVTSLEATVEAMAGVEEAAAPVADAVEDPYTITGTLEVLGLDSSDIETNNALDGCVISSRSGYSDISAGSQISVTDESGTLLATGRLDVSIDTGDAQRCLFRFTVEDVPASGFYTVEMGRRGGLSYTFAEMEANDWHVELVLGN